MKKLLVVLLCLGLVGCSTMRSSLRPSSNKPIYIYSISESDGKVIMHKALSNAFPNRNIPELPGSVVGYYSTSVFALDRHSIFVKMIPIQGVGLDGKVVSGYAFEVSDSGTMPITVGGKAKIIFHQILADASTISSPIEATNVKQIIKDADVKVDIDVSAKEESNKRPDLYAELMKLEDLRKNGILTEEEFQSQKKLLLEKQK